MWLSLVGTAFFMGLVGGVHCLVMCAAPCAAITAGRSAQRSVSIAINEDKPVMGRWLQFHIGRLLGYSLLGGVAAHASAQVAWFSDRSSVLYPAWVLLHLIALAWGLSMAFQARQPRWLEAQGRALWQKAQAWVTHPLGSSFAGCLWVLLPCGLLYSAVLVAALGSGFLQGAVIMLAFGLGTGLWLLAGSWLVRWLRQQSRWRESVGIRIAGLMLACISLWALWVDLVQQPALWCR